MGNARIVTLIAVCALLLAACGSTLRYDLGQLRSLPETRLFAPNSVVLSSGEAAPGHGNWGGSGPIPAYVSYQLGTAATPDEVEAFYRRELQQRGWTPYSGANFLNFNSAGRAILWRKGDLGFQLAFHRKDAESSHPNARLYATYYSIALTEIVQR